MGTIGTSIRMNEKSTRGSRNRLLLNSTGNRKEKTKQGGLKESYQVLSISQAGGRGTWRFTEKKKLRGEENRVVH